MSSEDSRPNTASASVPTAVQETASAGRMASVNAAVVSLDQIVLEKLVQMTAAVSLEEVSDFARISSLPPESEYFVSGKCIMSKCECAEGYIGDDCSLYDGKGKQAIGNTWHKLTRMPLEGRTGHCSAFAEELGAILIYGGFDLKAVSGELLEYKFSSGSWRVHDRESKTFIDVNKKGEDISGGNQVNIVSLNRVLGWLLTTQQCVPGARTTFALRVWSVLCPRRRCHVWWPPQ